MKITRMLGVALLSALVMGPAQAGGDQISPEYFRKMLPLKLAAVWKDKYNADVRILPDGKVKAKAGWLGDSGTWKLKGQEVCVAFRFWTFGKFKCGKIYKMGENSFEGMRRSNGKPRVRFTLK